MNYKAFFIFLSFCFAIDQTALDLGFRPDARSNSVTIAKKVTTNVQAAENFYACKELTISKSGHLHIANPKRLKSASAHFVVDQDILINGSISADSNVTVYLNSKTFYLHEGSISAHICSILADKVDVISSNIQSKNLHIGKDDITDINFDSESTIAYAYSKNMVNFTGKNIAAFGKITANLGHVEFTFSENIYTSGLCVNTRLHKPQSPVKKIPCGKFIINFQQANVKLVKEYISAQALGAAALPSDSALVKNFPIDTILDNLSFTNVVIKSENKISVSDPIKKKGAYDSLAESASADPKISRADLLELVLNAVESTSDILLNSLTIDAPIIGIQAPIETIALNLVNTSSTEKAMIYFADSDKDCSRLLETIQSLHLNNAHLGAKVNLLKADLVSLQASYARLTSTYNIKDIVNDASVIDFDTILPGFCLNSYTVINQINSADPLFLYAKMVKITDCCMDETMVLSIPNATHLMVINAKINLDDLGNLIEIERENAKIALAGPLSKDAVLEKYIVKNNLNHEDIILQRAKELEFYQISESDEIYTIHLAKATKVLADESIINLYTLGDITDITIKFAKVNVLDIPSEALLEKYTIQTDIDPFDPLLAIAKCVRLICINSLDKFNFTKAKRLELIYSDLGLTSTGLLTSLYIEKSSITEIEHIESGFKLNSVHFKWKTCAYGTLLPAKSAFFENVGIWEIQYLESEAAFDNVLLKNSRVDFATGLTAQKIKKINSEIYGQYPVASVMG